MQNKVTTRWPALPETAASGGPPFPPPHSCTAALRQQAPASPHVQGHAITTPPKLQQLVCVGRDAVTVAHAWEGNGGAHAMEEGSQESTNTTGETGHCPSAEIYLRGSCPTCPRLPG